MICLKKCEFGVTFKKVREKVKNMILNLFKGMLWVKEGFVIFNLGATFKVMARFYDHSSFLR